MDIIPSFDLLDGKLVRLRQGDFEQKTEYDASPLELAQELEAAGIRRLHIGENPPLRQAAKRWWQL